MRKITSLTALLSFLLLMLTSVILYIVPPGRVAYWAEWRLWGLSKTEWTNWHINLGVLFLIAIVLHTYYNWSAVMAYLKNQAKKFRLFTREFNVALVLVLLCLFGTYYHVPPFSSIVALGEKFSDDAARQLGEPPYGHAELSSLKVFCQRLDLDQELSLQRLRDAGYTVSSVQQTLLEVAEANHVAPNDLYLVMSPLAERVAKGLPTEPPIGLGKRPLIDLCQEYELNSKVVLRILKDQGIKAREEMSIKEIAEDAGMEAIEIYDLIRDGLSEEIR